MPIHAIAAQAILCPPMPQAMTTTVRDFISQLGASIGVVKTAKAADIGVRTEVVASTVFGKFPNADRVATLQTMASTYCSMLNQSGLSKPEMLSRWEVFQDKVLVLKTESQAMPSPPIQTQAPVSALAPVLPPASVQTPASATATAPQFRPPTVSALPADTFQRFAVTACGAVKDRQTGREWYVGPDRSMSWDQSVAWADNLSACGWGWRMPKTGELRSLFTTDSTAGTGYFTGGKHWPAHLDPAFSKIGEGSWVWSDRSVALSEAESYNFNRGLAVHYAKDNDTYSTRAFAVR